MVKMKGNKHTSNATRKAAASRYVDQRKKDRSDSRDEVDRYHHARSMRLTGMDSDISDYEDDDDDTDDDDDVENVMALGSDEEEEDDDDNDDDELNSKGDDVELRADAWGKSKSHYYSADDGQNEGGKKQQKQKQGKNKGILYGDNDEEAEEEAEALRLQEQQAARLTEADLDAFDAVEEVIDDKHVDAFDDDDDDEDKKRIERVKRDLSELSRDERLQIIIGDSPELLGLLGEFEECLSEVDNCLRPVMEAVKEGRVQTCKGVSFLEVKFHLLLSYCTNISFYLLLKAQGEPIKNHPVIQQLVRIRVILEKIRPLEQRLKYQIDKLLAASLKTGNDANGTGETDDALMHKPRLDNLVVEEGQEDDDVTAEGGNDNGVYVPPRLAAVPYDDEVLSKDEKKARRDLKRAKQSSLLRDLRDEFSSAPSEITQAELDRDVQAATGGRGLGDRWVADDDDAAHRQRYEEENFTRLILSKKDKKKMRQPKGQLDDLLNFGDFSAVDAVAGASSKGVAALIARASQSKGLRRLDGGDDDDFEREERAAAAAQSRKRHRGGEEEDHFGGFDDQKKKKNISSEQEEVAGNAYYEAIKATKKQRKVDKESVHEALHSQRIDDDDDENVDGKRGINYQIQKNKGLMPSRKKENRNARVKHRNKFQKAEKARKSQIRTLGSNVDRHAYAGEATGIRTNISRSTKM